MKLIGFVVLKHLPPACFVDAWGKSVLISIIFLQSNSSHLNVYWSLDTKEDLIKDVEEILEKSHLLKSAVYSFQYSFDILKWEYCYKAAAETFQYS